MGVGRESDPRIRGSDGRWTGRGVTVHGLFVPIDGTGLGDLTKFSRLGFGQ